MNIAMDRHKHPHANQHNPLWQYSLTVYQRPAVEGLLLGLQDDFGLDINLLLSSCWLASMGARLTAEVAAQELRLSEEWRQQCIEPLRSLRRFLKGQPQPQGFRGEVKALELAAEAWQQEQLYSYLSTTNWPEAAPVSQALALDNIHLLIVAIDANSRCAAAAKAAELVLALGFSQH